MPSSARPGGSLSPFIEALGSLPEMHAHVESWETKFYGTNEECKRASDKQELRIKGIWTWLPPIEIGEDEKEFASHTECSIEIHTAERVFMLAENEDISGKNRSQKCQGFVTYSSPRYSAEKMGSLRCVVFMGGHTLRELVRMLSSGTMNATVVITLGAAFEPGPHALTLLDNSSYSWNGKKMLEIVAAEVDLSVRQNVVSEPEVTTVKVQPPPSPLTIDQSDVIQAVDEVREGLRTLTGHVANLLDVNRQLHAEARILARVTIYVFALSTIGMLATAFLRH